MLMNNYKRQAMVPVAGTGCWVEDENGRRYLDALAGIGVNALGHAHPRLVAALREQVGMLIHTSNIYTLRLQEELARRLCAISGMDNAFFCNSGCEANEAAIKLARLHGHKRGIDAPTLVVMERAFHGRTLATLSASGNRKIQAGFEPLTRGFVRIPFNDPQALEQIADPSVVAVLYEPIHGEGGITIATREYQRFLRRLCDERQWLLIADEVQCGMARTGRWFGYQDADIVPDIVTMAKGLGGGVPIGACLARGTAATLFQPSNHGSTFGGNPLACRAALTVLSVVEEEKLLDNARRMGERLLAGLKAECGSLPGVVDIRGRGLMIGMELDRPCPTLVDQAIAHGLLINVTSERVVRLLPPLIVSAAEVDQILAILTPLVRAFLATNTNAEGTAVTTP